MENNFVIKENQHDNCLFGYIGSIVGAFIIMAIWYFIYKKTNFDVAILFGFVPYGALKGYQFLKGIVNKNTIATVSVVSIVIAICALYYAKENFITLELIENNLQIYIIFMIIGLVVTISKISRILAEYKAANDLIKDADDFALRPDSPIIESGSKLNNFQNSYKNFTSNTSSNTNKLNVASNTKSQNSYNNSNVYKNNNATKTYKYGKKLVYIYIAVIFLVVFAFETEIKPQTINVTVSTEKSNFLNDTFEMSVPDTWTYEEYGSSMMYFSNSESDFGATLYCNNKYYNEATLEEFTEDTIEMFKKDYNITDNINKQHINLNGKNAYKASIYKYDKYYDGYVYYYVYCVETDNYYIELVSECSYYDSIDFTTNAENMLKTLSEI